MRRLILTSATAVLAFLSSATPASAEWVWPLRGQVITPYRNGGDPYASGQHRGIDIAGDVGAPVVAAAGGEVRFADAAGSSGLTVSVRTADGRFDTSYLHLSSTAVRKGDRVAAGARLGAVGTSGVRSAATPHLHFGVREAGSRHAYHDPLGFLPPPLGPDAPRETPAPQPSPAPLAPVPAPERAPAGRRVPVRGPAPRRVPVRAPSPRRIPVGAPSPRRIPVGAPSARRIPVGAPSPHRAPLGAPTPRRVPVGEPTPRRVPTGSSSPGRLPAAAPHASELPAAERSPDRSGVGSPSGLGAAASSDRAAAPRGERPSLAASAGPGADRSASPAHTSPAHAWPGATGGQRDEATNEPSSSGPDLGLVLACVGLVLAALMLGLTDDGRKATRKTGHGIARVTRPLLGRR